MFVKSQNISGPLGDFLGPKKRLHAKYLITDIEKTRIKHIAV